MEVNKVQLKISNIKNVPLQTYTDDFLFIVNGEYIYMPNSFMVFSKSPKNINLI